jgi:DnaK suppressor protein
MAEDFMAKATAKTASAKKPPAKKASGKSSAAAPSSIPAAPKQLSTYTPAKLPSGYKPSAKEEYMSDLQREYFRQKLLAWRTELIDESRETLDHLHTEDWHQADIADRASLETEAGVELRTRNRYLKLISKIDAAIRRIETGEYGYCEETGEEIGLKRLEARPVATLSIEAQERHEKMERQYTDDD